jgi:tripartite-type tricarboxylate transporter receptor subunit TctC
MRLVVELVAAAGVAWLPLAGALAQPSPTKPVRLIAPFAPGGGIDILARGIAAPVAESFGQPVVIDNRPGAGGMTGAELVAKAPPDGYTVIMVASTYATTSAYGRPSYDPIDGIQPIVLIGTTGLVLTVHPSVPAKGVKELVGYAKGNPGRLNYSSVGTGSIPHLALELFKLETGVQCVHVPYKGAGPALVALVGGEVQLAALSMVPVLPHVRQGRLRALGITQPQRSTLLADVPTIGESVPGFEVIHWYGMWAPKGTPAPIVSRWNGEVAKVVRGDAMSARLRAEGLDVAVGPPQQFGEVIRRDVLKWRRVIQEAKIAREG